MKDEALSPRLIGGLIALTVAIFAASLLLTVRGDPLNKTDNAVDPIGPTSYSRSALGHLALFDFLKGEGLPVARSQYDSLAHLDPNGVLILAEPNPDSLNKALHAPAVLPRTILIVLPKYRPVPDKARKDWIGDAALMPEETVRQVFKSFTGAAEGLIVNNGLRIPPPPSDPKEGLQGQIVRVGDFAPQTTKIRLPTPSYHGPVQLLKNGMLTVLIGNSDGMLLGELPLGSHTLIVLTDPEALENHGLGEQNNAAFAKRLIELIRGPGGTVIFDETIHGYYKPPPDLLKTLFRFPYTLMIGQFCLAVILLLWAANRRFGALTPVPPARGAGRTVLIADAAALMDLGGHQAHLLQRYLQICVVDAARRLRAPPGLQGQALTDWLDRAGRAAGQQKLCSAVLTDIAWIAPTDLPRLFKAARTIHSWKKEIVDGPDRRSQNH